jgi:hypothetical protein
MSSEPKTPSFIPKQDEKKSARRNIDRIRAYLNAALFVASVIFVLAVAGALFSFLFKNLATDELAERQARLSDAKQTYAPEEIAELNRFDKRLAAVNQLLNQHQEISPVFEEIESYVLTTVQLKTAQVGYDNNNTIKVSGEGEAYNFEALALQSDEFTKSSFISNPIFTEFNRNEEDFISFEYSFLIDLALLDQSENQLDNPESVAAVNINIYE